MNNPFHRAAVKAFEDVYVDLVELLPIELKDVVDRHEFKRAFAASLESQARAFDACKRGTDISMQALWSEQSKALAIFYKRLKLDGNLVSASREFEQHMKPHFEIRLW